MRTTGNALTIISTQTRAARRRIAAVAMMLLGILGVVAIDLPLQGRFASPSLAEGADGGAADGIELDRPSIYQREWQSMNDEQLRVQLQFSMLHRQQIVFGGLSAQASGLIVSIFLTDANLGRELLNSLAGKTAAQQATISFRALRAFYSAIDVIVKLNPADEDLKTTLNRVSWWLYNLNGHFSEVADNARYEADAVRRLRAAKNKQKQK